MNDKTQSYNFAIVFDNNKKIPKNWKMIKIEECCDILDSKRIPLNSQERSKKQGNIPYSVNPPMLKQPCITRREFHLASDPRLSYARIFLKLSLGT